MIRCRTLLFMAYALYAFSSNALADGYLVFPQFATGDGLTSTVTLINPSPNDARTSVYIHNEDGSSAKDLPDGAFFIIPGMGSRSFVISANGAPRTGKVEVIWYIQSPNPFPPDLVGSLVISIAGIGSSAIQQGDTGNTFVVPAQRGTSLRTGLAIANVCPSGVPVTLTMRNEDGLPIGTASTQIIGNGHVSKFVDEFISLPATFTGVLSVTTHPPSSCNVGLSVAAYDLGNSLGQFVVLPVAKIN